MKNSKSLLALLAAVSLATACQATAVAPGSTTASPVASAAPQANSADQAFIDGMVPHHVTAVVMADDALAKANKAELKDFARRVKEDQSKEISDMKAWREAWFGSSTPPALGHDMHTTIAAGADYDVNWAKAMITHHQGAIDMSRKALMDASRAEVKSLAQRIIDAQQKEIDQLNAWIKAWSS